MSNRQTQQIEIIGNSMATKFTKKLSLKITVIFSLALCTLSLFPIWYIYHYQSTIFKKTVNDELSYTLDFLKIVYTEPLKEKQIDKLYPLNHSLLKNPMIVAINLYNTNGFVVGLQKDLITGMPQTNAIEYPFINQQEDITVHKLTSFLYDTGVSVGKLELFYTDKLIELYIATHKRQIIQSLGIVGVFVIISVILCSHWLIIRPIRQIMTTVKALARGEFQKRITIKGNDELSVLSQAINRMAYEIQYAYSTLQESEKRFRDLFDQLQKVVETENYEFHFEINDTDYDEALIESLNHMIQKLHETDIESKQQDFVKTGQTELHKCISGLQQLDEICENTLKYLVKYLHGYMGIIYIMDDDPIYNQLSLKATYACQQVSHIRSTFKLGEGLVGQSALEKEPIVISSIDNDGYKIESGLVSINPKHIIIYPLLFEGETKGVIEIGFIEQLNPLHIELMKSVSLIIAIAIHSAQFNAKLQKLLNQTREQALILEAQQEELKQANIYLEQQTQTLKASETKLQIQQEELQATNEELQEKTLILEEQKKEIEQKNIILQNKQIELQDKARELELATQYKSEFLANMSHELRTPLNTVLLLSKMLANNEETNLLKDQIDSLQAIYRSGENLMHLINGILDLSKLEARKVELMIDSLNLKELVIHMDMEFRHIAKEKKLNFLITLNEILPQQINTDGFRLEQIIRNLLSNAFKFTETGEVRLDISVPQSDVVFTKPHLTHEHTLCISVSDTGIGIPKEKQDIIFESFRQADGSTTRKHGGTGLGLSISKQLADLLGGELHLSSDYGKGSQFYLYIPEVFHTLNDHLAQKLSIPEPQKTDLPNSKQDELPLHNHEIVLIDKTILIVDDDMRNAFALSKLLKSNGMQIIIAENGRKSLELLANHPDVHLILMDMMMPEMDGYEAMKRIREQEAFRQLPILALTAKAMVSDRAKCIEYGASDYMSKPIDPSKLLSMLRVWLS
ncbi:MAG: response regulator [Desulfobacterales bacterium]|nr:response regulator [Desulfobacterales bacterium]